MGENVTTFESNQEASIFTNNSYDNSNKLRIIDGILFSKILIPKVNSNIIKRKRLLKKINCVLNKKLLLVTSPVGYGKTTLLANWAKYNNAKTIWLSLDEEDNNYLSMLKYLTLALNNEFDNMLESVINMINVSNKYRYDEIINVFLNGLSSISHDVVIILDDFHVIKEKSIVEIIKYILKYLPSNVHIIISSKEKLPFATAKLLAMGELEEISFKEICFTTEDIYKFFSEIYGIELNKEIIMIIEEKTEGWIIALKLIANRMFKLQNNAAYIDKLMIGVNSELFKYLTEEVLENVPAFVKEFLYKTSIFNNFSIDLCDKLLDRTDSNIILEMLERNNFFTFSLDESKKIYRYHNFFGELLRERLNSLYKEEIPSIYLNASNWFENNSKYIQSIEYSLKSQCLNNTERLIEDYSERIINDRQYIKLIELVEMMPAEILKKNKKICLYYAYTLAITGKLVNNEAYPKQRNINLDGERFRDSKTSISIIKSTAELHTECIDLEQVINLSNKALNNLENMDIRQAAIFNNLGKAYMLKGNLKKSKEYYIASIYIASQFDFENIAFRQAHMLAQTEICEGNINKAFYIYNELVNKLSELQEKESNFSNIIYLGIGGLYYEIYDIENASEYINKGIMLSKINNDIMGMFQGYIQFAYLLATQQRIKEAKEIVDIIENIYKSIPTNIILRQYISEYVRTLLIIKDFKKAKNIINIFEVDTNIDKTINNEKIIIALFDYQVHSREAMKDESVLDFYLKKAKEDNRINSYIKLLIIKALLHHSSNNYVIAIEYIKTAVLFAGVRGYVATFISYGQKMKKLLTMLLEECESNIYDKKLMSFINFLLDFFDESNVKDKKNQSLNKAVEVEEHSTCLSKREIEVLTCIADGNSNKEIAEKLYVSISTVKKHLGSIYDKLNVRTRTKALLVAKDMGIIK